MTGFVCFVCHELYAYHNILAHINYCFILSFSFIGARSGSGRRHSGCVQSKVAASTPITTTFEDNFAIHFSRLQTIDGS